MLICGQERRGRQPVAYYEQTQKQSHTRQPMRLFLKSRMDSEKYVVQWKRQFYGEKVQPPKNLHFSGMCDIIFFARK